MKLQFIFLKYHFNQLWEVRDTQLHNNGYTILAIRHIQGSVLSILWVEMVTEQSNYRMEIYHFYLHLKSWEALRFKDHLHQLHGLLSHSIKYLGHTFFSEHFPRSFVSCFICVSCLKFSQKTQCRKPTGKPAGIVWSSCVNYLAAWENQHLMKQYFISRGQETTDKCTQLNIFPGRQFWVPHL